MNTINPLPAALVAGDQAAPLRWRKSSRSGGASGQCVETAGIRGAAVAVRDSKNPAGPRLAFSAAEWRSFAERVKDGRFDLA